MYEPVLLRCCRPSRLVGRSPLRRRRKPVPGCGCRTLAERVINVVTSLPFSAVGLHMLRQRQTAEGRRHGASLVAVGAMAALYHAVPSFGRGRCRDVARKLDYWTISWSAALLVSAAPRAPRAASGPTGAERGTA